MFNFEIDQIDFLPGSVQPQYFNFRTESQLWKCIISGEHTEPYVLYS